MEKIPVAIIGATGMVGQKLAKLLWCHPWFEIRALAASERSAGKTYKEALKEKGVTLDWMPDQLGGIQILNATHDMRYLAQWVSLVFCATDMNPDETRELEDGYARLEKVVVSANSAHRWTPDVPMLIPEINADHLRIIPAQKKRLGTNYGFVTVKPNCATQPVAAAIGALWEFMPIRLSVCTYQALSGAGKTLATFPDMKDNIMPLPGEEEKSETEPLKIWGYVEGDKIVPAGDTTISAQCFRVPVSDGHLATVAVQFHKRPTEQQILDAWANFRGQPQTLDLPSAPKQFLQYHAANNRPQTKLDRNAGDGMAISLGRLRPDPIWDWKFHALSHNTIRGAAGGCVLTAELLVAQGYLPW